MKVYGIPLLFAVQGNVVKISWVESTHLDTCIQLSKLEIKPMLLLQEINQALDHWSRFFNLLDPPTYLSSFTATFLHCICYLGDQEVGWLEFLTIRMMYTVSGMVWVSVIRIRTFFHEHTRHTCHHYIVNCGKKTRE